MTRKTGNKHDKNEKKRECLRVLCTADIHDEPLVVDKIIDLAKKKKIDLVVIAGDFGSTRFALETLNRLDHAPVETIAVRGNWDYFSFEGKKARVLDFDIVEKEGYHFLCASDIPHDFCKKAEKLSKNVPGEKLVLVTHYPPLGILDEMWNGMSMGEPEILRFIERKRPLLHVCGHIEEQAGKQWVGDTLVLNAAYREYGRIFIVELPSLKTRTIKVE